MRGDRGGWGCTKFDLLGCSCFGQSVLKLKISFAFRWENGGVGVSNFIKLLELNSYVVQLRYVAKY